jgi:hypothetical protein
MAIVHSEAKHKVQLQAANDEAYDCAHYSVRLRSSRFLEPRAAATADARLKFALQRGHEMRCKVLWSPAIDAREKVAPPLAFDFNRLAAIKPKLARNRDDEPRFEAARLAREYIYATMRERRKAPEKRDVVRG